jgi:DNA repair protein RadA/Sms
VRRLQPPVTVVDSIQTIWAEALGGAPGSVGQVRECAAQLSRLAKTTGGAMLVVCHVTKDGMLAGPRTLEHLADCVLEFEGDRHHLYRLLRGLKNRYGSTSELGVFEMTGTGLKEVVEPGELFLPNEGQPAPGRAVAACLEGSRPLLVEVQALVADASYGYPQRRGSGIDANRLAILLAVLEQRAGLRLAQSDVFLNVAGGLLIEEPAADLAAALEVGLSGELRPVVHLERRLEEAARLGYKRAVVPRANVSALRGSAPAGLVLDGVADVVQAAEAAVA